MVLDRVVSPAGQHLGHFCPLAAVRSVSQEENPLLMQHPFNFEDVGVEVVVPSLAALLAQTALDELSDEGPALRPVLLNQLAHQIVLLLCPGFLAQKFGFVDVGLRNGLVIILLWHFLLVGLLDH